MWVCVSIVNCRKNSFLTASTFEIVTHKETLHPKRVKVGNIQLNLYVCTAHALLTFFSYIKKIIGDNYLIVRDVNIIKHNNSFIYS